MKQTIFGFLLGIIFTYMAIFIDSMDDKLKLLNCTWYNTHVSINNKELTKEEILEIITDLILNKED